jgi:hypothetical protein
MPFTNENAALRIKRLVAAISLLDERDAAVAYKAFTDPQNDKQKHLKERFGRLSTDFSRQLLSLLLQKTKSPEKTADAAPEARPKYQEGKAAWVELQSGVFGYVPQSAVTLNQVGAYVSGNPKLPKGLSKLNRDVPVDQPLEAGRPVIIPAELIDQDRAWGEMSTVMGRRIWGVAQSKFAAERQDRIGRVRPGALGPGMHGPFPVTLAMARAAANFMESAIEALWAIIKKVGYVIAFAGGIIHGFLASIWDTISGIAKMIYDLVGSIISGELKDDISKFIDGMKKLTWENVKDMIGDWATKWHKKLNDDSVWVAGHAHGYLTGYVMAEVAMLLISGGTTAGLKAAFWTSRVGKAVKASSAFVAAEQKVAKLIEKGGEITKVVDKVRESRIGAPAVKVVEKTLEVAGWTAGKIVSAISFPGKVGVAIAEQALIHAKKLGPFFDRIGKLTQRAKNWLFGCASPCVWDADTLAFLMSRFVDEEIEVLCTASNRAVLMQKKWFEKTLKVGDDLPTGYHWRDGDIVRSPGKRKAEYAPLAYDKQTKKINVGIAGERISNPSVMNKNYKAQVRERIREQHKGQKLTDKQLEAKVAKEVGEHAVHHLIPDNLIQDHALGKAARKAGYDLDRGPNLQGLRKNQRLTDKDAGDIGHWSSHPKYDKLVDAELTRVQKVLEKEFGSLDKVPNARMLDEMKKVESKFRQLFESKKVPLDPDTGRLVEVSPVKEEEEEVERAYA